MAEIINTQSAAYQQYLTGLDTIRTYYTPKLKIFAKLPRAKQKLWLQRDPLLRKLLRLSFDLTEWASQFTKETEND
jgi:hypothetical protein